MADEEKHQAIREMKQRFDENNAKLRNVSWRAGGRRAGGRTWRGGPASCRLLRRLLPPRPLLLPALLAQLESQRRTSEAALRRAAFTAAQLDELPEDVATYRSVGKA